jgi:hypothetical protein
MMARVALAVAVVAVGGGSPARAVDVVNRDKVPRQVVVNSSDGQSQVLTVPAREKVGGVCSDCVVLLGNTSVEAKGAMTVMVEGGKVSIGSQR